MRRFQDAQQCAEATDYGDDKSAEAKKHRKSLASELQYQQQQESSRGRSGGGGLWAILMGLPWGLSVCLLYLLLDRPQCQDVTMLEVGAPSEEMLLRRGDFTVFSIDRIPRPGESLQVVMEGREWLLLMWSSKLFTPGDDTSCHPTAAALPTVGNHEAGGQLFQVAAGEAGGAKVSLTLGAELLKEGASARHSAGWLLYRAMTAEQCEAQGDGRCSDNFVLELPCGGGAKQVSMLVSSPSPVPDATPGILKLSGASVSQQGIRVGDGAVRIEGVAFDQDAATQLKLDTWELAATAIGGKVILDEGVRAHLSTSVTGISEIHEGEHGLVARGTLVGMRLLLVHIMYHHSDLLAGQDLVVITLSGQRTEASGSHDQVTSLATLRSDVVTIPMKVSIACDAHESQVSGSGLTKGKALIYVDVLIQCYDTSGVVRTSGGDNVTVVLRSGNAFEQHLVAQDRTDGTYLARFIRPNAAYDLDLVINGQTHDKGPYFVSPDKLPSVRAGEVQGVQHVVVPQTGPSAALARQRAQSAREAYTAMGRRGGTPELPEGSPARQEYNKYIDRLQGLKASGKYETASGGEAPNSRGHEEDIDQGAFGFGELDTGNAGDL